MEKEELEEGRVRGKKEEKGRGRKEGRKGEGKKEGRLVDANHGIMYCNIMER